MWVPFRASHSLNAKNRHRFRSPTWWGHHSESLYRKKNHPVYIIYIVYVYVCVCVIRETDQSEKQTVRWFSVFPLDPNLKRLRRHRAAAATFGVFTRAVWNNNNIIIVIETSVADSNEGKSSIDRILNMLFSSIFDFFYLLLPEYYI